MKKLCIVFILFFTTSEIINAKDIPAAPSDIDWPVVFDEKEVAKKSYSETAGSCGSIRHLLSVVPPAKAPLEEIRTEARKAGGVEHIVTLPSQGKMHVRIPEKYYEDIRFSGGSLIRAKLTLTDKDAKEISSVLLSDPHQIPLWFSVASSVTLGLMSGGATAIILPIASDLSIGYANDS